MNNCIITHSRSRDVQSNCKISDRHFGNNMRSKNHQRSFKTHTPERIVPVQYILNPVRIMQLRRFPYGGGVHRLKLLLGVRN